MRLKKERSFLSEDLISELLSLSKFDKDFKFKRSSILESISNIKYCDIIYLDPPYTTRRYETNYHILEYIADINFNIEKIKYNTKAGTPDLSLIKNPFGGKNTTYKIFEEMIVRGVEKCKYLFISYSNQGFMKESDIREICNKYKLVLETESIKHKKYKSHGNDVQGELFEILWVIKKSDNI